MSDLKPQNLIIGCFDSLGSAYQAIQSLNESVHVLEIFPLGLQGHCILYSENSLEAIFQNLKTKFKESLIDMQYIPECAARVLRAYLSVENAELEKHLLIQESPYIGDLFVTANQAIHQGLKIVDLRMLRGASSASYLFITGSESLLQKFTPTKASKSTLILNANDKICELFAVNPQLP